MPAHGGPTGHLPAPHRFDCRRRETPNPMNDLPQKRSSGGHDLNGWKLL